MNSSIIAMGGTVDEMHKLLMHLGQLDVIGSIISHLCCYGKLLFGLLRVIFIRLVRAVIFMKSINEISGRLARPQPKPRALRVPADQSLQNASLLAPDSCIFNLARE